MKVPESGENQEWINAERSPEELSMDPFLVELKAKRESVVQESMVPASEPVQADIPVMVEPPVMEQPIIESFAPDPAAVDPALRYAAGSQADMAARDWETAKNLELPFPSSSWDRAVLEEETRYRKLVGNVQHPSLFDHPSTNAWLQNPANIAIAQNEMGGMKSIGDARDRAIAADKLRIDAANKAGRVSAWLSPFVSLGKGAANLAGLPGDMLYLLTSFSSKLAGEAAPVREKGTLEKAKEYLGNKEIATPEFFVRDPVTGEDYFNPQSLSASNAAKLVAGEIPSMAAMVGVSALSGGAATPVAIAEYGPWAVRAVKLLGYMKSPVALINTARVAQSVHEDGIKYLMAKGQTEGEASANSAPGAILAGVGSSLFGSPMEAKIVEGWAESMARQPVTASLGRRVLTMLKQIPIQGSKEGIQEVMEGIGEDVSKWVTFQSDLTIKQATQNMVTNALGGAIVGGVMGGALHAPMALNAAAKTDYFAELKRHIEESKMPEPVLIDQVKTQMEGGPGMPSVSPEALETLWQGMGLDPEETAKNYGIKDFSEALVSGQEVLIEPETLVKMVKDGSLEKIQPDIRHSPGAQTQREEEAYQKDAERIKDQVKQGIPLDEELDPEFTELREYMRSQLIAAGRSEDVAATESLISAAGLTNVARREGFSPKWILDTYGPKVTRAGPDEQGSIIQRAMERVAPRVQAGESPEEAIKAELPADQQAEGLNWWETYFQNGPTAPIFYSALGRSIPDIAKISDKQGMIDPGMQGLPLFQRGGGRYASKAQKDAAKARMRSLNTGKTYTARMAEHFKAEMEENAAAFDAFDSELTAALAGEVLAEPRKGKKKGSKAQEPLGFFQYRDLGEQGKETQIGFMSKADLTTFVHENTHLIMRVMQDLAERPEATEGIKSDWKALMDYAGAKDGKLDTAGAEKLAQAGEKYLLEGKAPSLALREAFARVKSWLSTIYNLLKTRNLDVRLNDDVRAVFDRIYATDAEIEEARGVAGDRPLLTTPEKLGMTPSAHAAYSKAAKLRIDAAIERADAKKMKDLVKDRKDFLVAERERLLPEIEAQVNAEPVYQAIEILSDGKMSDGTPIKLFKPALVEKYGEGRVKDLPASVRLGYKIKGEGSIDADGAAELLGLGFRSGEELIESMGQAEKKEAKIVRLVDERVKALHGDVLDPETLARDAQDAIHEGDPEDKYIELRELRRAERAGAFARQEGKENVSGERQAGQRAVQAEKLTAKSVAFWSKGVINEVPSLEVFKNAAREIIGATRGMDLNPNKYLNAQRKLSSEAFRALAAQDYKKAADAKQNEILNHFLYREARAALDAQEETAAYVKKLFRPSMQQRIAKAGGDQGERVYLAQIFNILDQFGWTKESRVFVDWKTDVQTELSEWLGVEQAKGNLEGVDPSFLASPKNYRELTPIELQGVTEALKQIETAARANRKVLLGDRKADKEEAINHLLDSLYGNFKIAPPPSDRTVQTRIDKAVSKVKTLDASMIKMEQWIDRMDGGDIKGWWRKAVFEPLALAQYKEYELTRDVTSRLAEAMEKMPKEIRKNLDETVDIPGLGVVSRKWILSAALNWGNDSNRQKMLKGEALADFTGIDAMSKALATMTKGEWEFVQGVWDTLKVLRPEIEAQELKLNGIAPKWVEVKPFVQTLPDGTAMRLDGGYYPVVYDPKSSNVGKMQADAVYDAATGSFSYPKTSTGHTKARVEDFSRKMLLDFESVLGRHFPKVIKDLSHREAVQSVARILGDERISTALNETIGPEYAGEFWPWLVNTVNDTAGVNDPSIQGWRHLLNTMRQNMVIGTLGFRAGSVFVQLSDFTRVLVGSHAISPLNLGISLSKFTAEFAKYAAKRGKVGFPMLDLMREMSPEMRARAENLDRDVRGALRRLSGKDGALVTAQQWGFKGLAIADALTSTVSWWASFNQATQEGKTKTQAIAEADRTVRLKLMTGAPKDQVSLQAAGDMGMKFITMFMGDAVNSYGLTREAFANLKNKKQIMNSIFALTMVGIISPILADILKNKVPEDDEEKKKYLAGKLIFGLPNSVPMLRDIVGAFEGGYSYKYTPVQTVMEKTIRTASMISKKAEGEDVAWDDLFVTGLESAGLMGGIPGVGQIGTSYRYLDQISEGKISRPESNFQHMRNLIFGPPPKPKGGK
jgi:hypothetical protein